LYEIWTKMGKVIRQKLSKFRIWGKTKQNSHFWINNSQLIDKKNVNFFHIHWHYQNTFTAAFMPRITAGCMTLKVL